MHLWIEVMKILKIRIGKDRFALVDQADYDFIKDYLWYCSANKWGAYVQGFPKGQAGNNRKRVSMHRVILNAPKGMCVDHINGNGLDNRRGNIRLCTPAENSYNRKLQHNSTSGHRGVYWHKASRRWRARISYARENISLGYYNNLEDAAKAYKEAAKKYYGEFCPIEKPE